MLGSSSDLLYINPDGISATITLHFDRSTPYSHTIGVFLSILVIRTPSLMFALDVTAFHANYSLPAGPPPLYP